MRRCDRQLRRRSSDLGLVRQFHHPLRFHGRSGLGSFFPGEKVSKRLACPTPGGTFKIVVDKRRQLLPTWITHVGHRLNQPAAPPGPTCADPRLILEARTPDLTFAVGVRTYTVLVRHQRWWLESGGFYAFSWARDKELVTVTEDVDGKSKVRIEDIRQGDRIGPVTGVTFVFHPADPEYAGSLELRRVEVEHTTILA